MRDAMFGYLPLHFVLHNDCFADQPYDTTDGLRVKLLLEFWPKSILQHDGDGGLPLREALKCNFHASLAVIELLVKTSPDTVRVQDRFSCSPLHHALDCSIRSVDAADYLHLIKLLVENWPELLQKKTD